MTPEQGEQAQVIFFRQRYVERINGIQIDLGRLSLLEMELLEEQCNLRFLDAHTDLTIVRDTKARLFPEGEAS